MPKKYKTQRFTDRDVEIVTWIAEQSLVRFDTLQDLFAVRKYPVDVSVLRSICERWVRMGLIKKERLLGNAPSILWATGSAMKLAGLSADGSSRSSTPSFSTIHHSCAVSAVRVEYEKFPTQWICEKRLRNKYSNEHLADALVIHAGKRILVEIDRTQKESRRLTQIMSQNARTPGVSAVDYWTTDALYPVIESHIKRLDADISSKVRVFLLPKAVNL